MNDYYKKYTDLEYVCKITDKENKELVKFSNETFVGENESKECFDISWVVEGKLKDTFHVCLQLFNKDKKEISHNNYTLLIMDQEEAKKT